MNRKMKRYLILILGVLSFISCGKFLEEFSQDLAYAESCTDLDEILIGNGYMEQPLYFAEASVYGGGYYLEEMELVMLLMILLLLKISMTGLIN